MILLKNDFFFLNDLMIHLPSLVPGALAASLRPLFLDLRFRMSAQKGRLPSGRSKIGSASLKMSVRLCACFFCRVIEV